MGGVEVLSPQEAVARFGATAVFVVAIWHHLAGHPVQAIRDQLGKWGRVNVISFRTAFWKYPRAFLPYFDLDTPSRTLAAAPELKKVAALLQDEISRKIFLSELAWRLQADAEGFSSSEPVSNYVDNGLLEWSNDEVFVDCGACDGDTVSSILGCGVSFKHIISLEPDPRNFGKLHDYVQTLDRDTRERIVILQSAVGAGNEKLRFNAEGTDQSMISETGGIEVDCGTLDRLVAPYRPTYIKMEIEGAEGNALLGMRAIAREFRPVIAVSIYHRPDDLWRLPLLMQSITPQGYRFGLRRHSRAGWDLLAYAIPEQRYI